MSGRHHLHDEDGRETQRAVVFLDACYGWVREVPGTFNAGPNHLRPHGSRCGLVPITGPGLGRVR